MTSDTSGSVPLLPTKLCRRAGEVVIVCTESPRQHEVHAHEDLPLKNLVVRQLLVRRLQQELERWPVCRTGDGPARKDSVGTHRVAVPDGRQRDVAGDVKQDLERVIAPEAVSVAAHVGVEGVIKCSEGGSRLVVSLEGVISGEFLARLLIFIEQFARLSSASADAIPDDFESEDVAFCLLRRRPQLPECAPSSASSFARPQSRWVKHAAPHFSFGVMLRESGLHSHPVWSVSARLKSAGVLGERLVRVWIAVDPEESAVEPEAVDRHAAAAKLVQNVGHVLRILTCQQLSGLDVVHQRVQTVLVQHVLDILAAMTQATLFATTWQSLSFVMPRVFLCRSRLRSAARSFLGRCPAHSLSVRSLSTPRLSAHYGSLGVVHPAMQRGSAAAFCSHGTSLLH